MHQLSDLALEAILKEFDPQKYDPPHTDVREWIHAMELLCDTYGVPDVQRPQCAVAFAKDELSTDLRNALAEVRATFGPVHWDPFKNFMVAFNHNFREQWEKLPVYKKHPKLTWIALGVAGGGGVLVTAAVVLLLLLFAPAIGILSLIAGFISVGVTAVAVAVQFSVYGSATGGLFSLLQSVAATVILKSIGTIFTWVVAGAGLGSDRLNTGCYNYNSSELLYQAVEAIAHDEDDDNDNVGGPQLHPATAPEEHLLTPMAILAIVKAWGVGTYNPPGTNCASWLGKVHKNCERYEIPAVQRAPCAMHHLRADCMEDANTSGCYDMTWEEFTVWLHQYDREDRRNTNRRIAKLSARE